MNNRRRAVVGLIALAAACLTTETFASTAYAGSDNYIQFKQNAAFLATTCYHWQGAEQKDYCNNSRPLGDSWKVYFPANATGVVIDLKRSPWESAQTSLAMTDANRNYCVEVSGTLLNPTLQKTGC